MCNSIIGLVWKSISPLKTSLGTDTAFEAMAEEMDSEDYAGFIEHLAEEAAAETAEETADYSKTA